MAPKLLDILKKGLVLTESSNEENYHPMMNVQAVSASEAQNKWCRQFRRSLLLWDYIGPGICSRRLDPKWPFLGPCVRTKIDHYVSTLIRLDIF